MQLGIVCIDGGEEKGNMPTDKMKDQRNLSVCVCLLCTSHQLHIYIMSSCRLVLSGFVLSFRTIG